jgi:hypothetical protein
VACVAGVIPSATERWVLWEIPYARALHYQNLYLAQKGVEMTSVAEERRRQKRALDIVRGP